MSDLRTPPPPPKPNQRQHPRVELLASVELHAGDETVILPAKNLSLGGIFLGADGNDLTRLEVGKQVEVLVFNAANEAAPAVRAFAEVVRHADDGIGLQWKKLSKQESKQLATLLEEAGKK